MRTIIEENRKNAILEELRTANLAFQKTYPGDRAEQLEGELPGDEIGHDIALGTLA